MRRKTTLAQVAVTAGVSKSTASYVLNGERKMSDETTAKVLKAAKDLGYRLDSKASGLRKGGSEIIGVLNTGLAVELVEGHSSLFWPRLAGSFIQRCSADGVVASFVDEDRAQMIMDSGIDALVVLGAHAEEAFTRLRVPFGLPTISLAPIEGEGTVTLGHDADKIAEAVCGHFREQGARSVAWVTLEVAQPMVGDWSSALDRASSAHGMDFASYTTDATDPALRQSVAAAIDAGADAIFSLTGDTKPLLEAIRATGKSIPDDVLVVVQAEGLVEESMEPAVSTLSLDGAGSAEVIERVVVALIRGIPFELEDLPFELTPRASSQRS